MSSTLSLYYNPHHGRNSDEGYMRRLIPAWVRIHQPTARAIYTVTKNAPDARIMLRSWDIDDHNGDRKREMYADPKGAARKHLDMWRAKWGDLLMELHRNTWIYNEARWYIGLVNEPDPAYIPQIVEYSLEAMRLVRGTDIRLGLVCSSVGTFAKPGEAPRSWADFKVLETPMREGRHILIVHEYWQKEGPSGVWVDTKGQTRRDAGHLAWRHRSIPLDVPILIGEAGANGYIYGRDSQADDAGWGKLGLTPTQYAAQVREYIEGCDSRVQGVCLFMTDYHSDQWRSFDTAPAHEALLAIRDVRPSQPKPQTATATGGGNNTGPKPQPPAPAPAGIIDPLVAQTLIQVESGGQAFGPGGRLLIRFEAHIFRQKLGNDDLFNRHFRYGSPVWTDQRWRRSAADPWIEIHAGQGGEYAAFELAASLNRDAAYQSISMGLGQIMGFNARRVGYASAEAMYQAFSSEWQQVFAFVNFFLSDPSLAQAVRAKDWRTIARLYNGPGNVDKVAPLLESTYKQLGGL